MRNARNANYLQVNHEIRQIFAEKGVVVRPSREAYREFKWTRVHFGQKPKEGYFIWVRKQVDFPIFTCIAISSPKVSQTPRNLVVIDESIKAEIYSTCNATKKGLCGDHTGHLKVILKENSELKLRHHHAWGKGDTVASSLTFLLGKGAKLSHVYRCLAVPRILKTELRTTLKSRSSASFEIAVLAKGGNVDMRDSTFLNGDRSSATMRLRTIADKNSRIDARSKMIANGAGKGHLDCMGMLLSKNSTINVVPELLNKNKDATLTHEASIGKISEEALNYLRSRGLTEDEAIDLIVKGFLGEDMPFTYKGRLLPSKVHM
jgi:Fe-S cluster assembly scaffold protein SufB